MVKATAVQILAELVNHCETTVLRLKGEVDLAVRDVFAAHLRQALAASSFARTPRLIVDLQEVSFLSSVGLRGLLECTRAGAKKGIGVLVVADPTAMRLIAVGDPTRTLAAYPTLDDALNGYPHGT